MLSDAWNVPKTVQDTPVDDSTNLNVDRRGQFLNIHTYIYIYIISSWTTVFLFKSIKLIKICKKIIMHIAATNEWILFYSYLKSYLKLS